LRAAAQGRGAIFILDTERSLMSDHWNHGTLLAGLLTLACCGLEAPLLAQDCNCNGRSDPVDIREGASSDCNRNNVPDECDLLPQTEFTLIGGPPRAGMDVRSIAIADIDGDGRPDLAAGSRGSGTVTLLLNAGGRRLESGREIRLGAAVHSIVAADLDGDGAADLAFSIPFAAVVLLAGAERDYRERREIAVHSNPAVIAAGDIDGDGDIDLVTANSLAVNPLDDNVSILLNGGGGDFEVAANYLAVKSPSALILADIDGNGALDIAVTGRSTTHGAILLNSGGGLFTPAQPLPIGSDLGSLAAGDLDGDGHLDLAAGGTRELIFLLNRGAASFQRSSMPLPAGAESTSILARDLDADGNLDVVLGGGRIIVVWNVGKGGMNAPVGLASRCSPSALAAADLDGDGALDLALAGGSLGCVGVLWNDALEGIGAARTLHLPRTSSHLLTADLDLDGNQDLIVSAGSITLYRNHGDGRFGETQIELPVAGRPVCADLDSDSRLDLAVIADATVAVLWNEPPGTFPNRQVLFSRSTLRFSSHLAAADLDGDGDLDLVVADGGEWELLFYRNDGGRRFERAGHVPLGQQPGQIVAGDFDEDGREDLVVGSARVAGSRICILWNLGSFSFDTATQVDSVVQSQQEIRAGDIDGDGDLDIVASGFRHEPNGEHGAWIFHNLGDRGFSLSQSLKLEPGSLAPELADLDGDGRLDLAVAGAGLRGGNARPGILWTFANQVEGVLMPARMFRAGSGSAPSVTAADFDGDGSPDLAWSPGNEVQIQLDPWRTRETGRSHYGLGGHVERALAADLDGDGRRDVITASSRDGAIAFRRGLGNLEYADARLHFAAESPAALASADLDGDGREELLCADAGGAFLVLSADQSGGLAVKQDLPLPSRPVLIEVADLDGDGDLDLALACDLGNAALEDAAAVLWNAGDGSLASAVLFSLSPATLPASLTAADLDTDGRLDLAVAGRGAPPQWLRNRGRGGFEPAASLGEDLREYSVLAAADLDGDGAVDLLLGGNAEVRLFRNRGGGKLERSERLHARAVASIDVRDLDGDGAQDLLFFRCGSTGSCSYFPRWGSVAGEAARCGPAISSVAPAPPADLDGDGHLDLITINNSNTVRILTVSTSPAIASDRNRNGIIDSCEASSFHRGDATGEGRVDLADAIHLLAHLFLAGPAPGCLDAADANDDGALNLADPLFLLLYLFRGGAPPPPPGPPPAPCGLDSAVPGKVGELGCRVYAGCS
jgi:hypothetical protein